MSTHVKVERQRLENWLFVLNYWLEHVEDLGERYPEMEPFVKKFDAIIDEIYNYSNKRG
jgi:hypothetical protein